MSGVPVSVVLPTFGREELLCRTLADLLRLDQPDLEIVVVDQTPVHRPPTETFLDALPDRVVRVRQEQPSVVVAANAGVRVARGEILVFVDDDIHVPGRDLVTLHLRNYDDPGVAGVAGRVLDAQRPEPGRFDPRSADPVWGFFHTGWSHDTRCDVWTAPGANMSFRREVVVGLGGFDERFRGNAFRWENDFCVRVRNAGGRVVYDPGPTVHHFYASPGGNDNRHLMGRDPGSHRWYRNFFHNHVYCALKHQPRASVPPLLWKLYRGHVLNRPYVTEGPAFVLARHRAYVAGVRAAWATYGEWRRASVNGSLRCLRA